jgi:hypothetical protein
MPFLKVTKQPCSCPRKPGKFYMWWHGFWFGTTWQCPKCGTEYEWSEDYVYAYKYWQKVKKYEKARLD